MPAGLQMTSGPAGRPGARHVVFVPPILQSRSYAKLRQHLPPGVVPRSYTFRLAEWAMPPVAYSIGWEVVGLKELLQRERISRAHWVSSGWASGTALAFAMCYPERVQSLVLEDPVFLGPSPLTTADEEAYFEFRRCLELPGPDFYSALLRFLLSPDEVPEWRRYSSQPRPTEEYARIRTYAQALLEYPAHYEALRKVEGPVLVVLGGSGPEALRKRAERLVSLFPRARLRVFDGFHRFRSAHEHATPEFIDEIVRTWEASDDPTGPFSGSPDGLLTTGSRAET
jgi:pimeloyl-ACP methyl ester carboxylesterase